METSIQMRLQHQPQALQYLLQNLPETQIISKLLPGKWSIFENIAHLGRYNEVFLERMKIIQTEDNPLFSRYVADNEEGFLNWCRKTFQQVLNDFYSTRKEMNNYLFALTNEKIRKTGQHPLYGIINVNGWTEFFLLHEAHHFFTIFKLAAMMKKETLPNP